MKKYILKSLFVSMLCMLAASCQDTDEFAQTVDSSKTQVMFTIAMDSPLSRSGNNATDTSWGGTYENCVGDDYDNRIALNQLVAEIETAEGKKYPVSGIISEDNKYSFVGVVENIKSSITLKNAKITVYANMGDKAQNRTFKQKEDFIPMWGFQTMSELKLEPGTRTKIEPISLLRAMAKIEVALNEEMAQDYTLSGVTLNKYNTIGNSLPTIPTSNNGKPSVQNTKQLDQENVFNVNQSEGKELGFVKNETKASWSVYLPEVENKGDLEITVEFDNGDTGKFKVMDYNYEEPLAMDIVRNHWYKYTISGFAESEIQVSYNTVGWEEKFIEIGGDGFLFLNKDVIEIYNSNTDADQLKFSSSSKIKSIVLKDIYKHENDGTFTEGTLDGVSAYYITKFGQKIQLGTYPGFDVEEGALDKENNIIKAISAVPVYDETGLNGGITINSPYIGHATYGNSHYNTIRYLEFEVTNEQDLTATFRVMQYPPVVITNEEGYFSYRSDQKLTDDQEEASHFHNYQGGRSLHCTGLYFYHEHEWSKEFEQTQGWWDENRNDRDYSWVNPQGCPDNRANSGSDIVNYGYIANPVVYHKNGKEVQGLYAGLHRPTTHPTDYFLRWRYYGIGASNNDSQGLAISGLYQKDDGRWYRKHYVWDVQIIFYNLYVDKVYQEDGTNRKKGQADICSMYHATSAKDMTIDSPGTGWAMWGKQRFTNHRMYNIRMTSSQNGYTIGYPILTKEGVTKNTPSNANMLSPNFMVASQLGETYHQSIITKAAGYGYKVPVVGEFYQIAVEHCREYVETTYSDLNNNQRWDVGEPVTHYDDWRLPTKAEINKIIELQGSSRAMDRLLDGQYYFCAAGSGENADVEDEENWVSKQVDGYDTVNKNGYYIRCVRDVKP